MRRSLALVLSTLLVATGMSLAGSVTAEAAPTCTYTPVPPKRVVVNRALVTMRVPLRTTGPSDCKNKSVAVEITHRTDRYDFLWESASTYDQGVYAVSVSAGTYRTTSRACSAFDAASNPLSCSVTPVSTVIKFGGHVKLKAKRKGKRVTLTVRTSRYNPAPGVKWTTARVSIQRKSGSTWHTVKHATAKGKAGYKWTFTKRARARYRVVAAETRTAFAATSRSVKK